MDNILIVEDDRFFRDMFSGLLRANGYEVDCASCGNEGLQMLSEKQYRLVITDLVMPDVSGMQVLSRVKEDDPSIDVIMVTGNANLESAIFALKHGARDYLIKPVDPDELLHLVGHCLEQRRILEENDELKGMLSLFQTSQTIAGCLEIERICHLLLDALARELGLTRGIGLFRAENGFEVKEVKGVSVTVAELIKELILPAFSEDLKSDSFYSHIDLKTNPAIALEISDSGIEQAYLVFVRSKESVHGLMVLFNDRETVFPDLNPKTKNIRFLVEQASLAFDNAGKYLQARDMLFIDDLSGMFNYRYLEVALERELKRVERYSSHLSVLFLDMDAFKQVNDTYGHLVGSRVLKEMGAVLKKAVREVDIVIRYGGDEYTVILVETPSEMAMMVAERIRRLVDTHLFLASEGYSIHLTCSIGYSCCPDDTMSKEELLEMADQAMYSGKSRGKNCVTRFSVTGQ